MKTVHLNPMEVSFGATNFSTAMGIERWRVYQVGHEGDAWLLELAGPDAMVKAKAIAMLLNGND